MCIIDELAKDHDMLKKFLIAKIYQLTNSHPNCFGYCLVTNEDQSVDAYIFKQPYLFFKTPLEDALSCDLQEVLRKIENKDMIPVTDLKWHQAKIISKHLKFTKDGESISQKIKDESNSLCFKARIIINKQMYPVESKSTK